MPKYKNNFLTRVIFRLDFSENIPIGNLQEFTKTVSKNFPIKEEKIETAIIFDTLAEDNDSKNKIEKNTFWIFHSQDKKKRLGVSMHFIYLEYDKYDEFSEVETDIKEAVIKFLNDFNVKTVNRIGFRCINEIKLKEPNQLNWADYINTKLISAIGFAKNKKVARIMGQIVIKEELGDLTFNYGIWNKEFPNEINEKEFMLDIDCHSKLGIASDEILSTAQAYHSYVEKVFESSIKQGLKDKMNS